MFDPADAAQNRNFGRVYGSVREAQARDLSSVRPGSIPPHLVLMMLAWRGCHHHEAIARATSSRTRPKIDFHSAVRITNSRAYIAHAATGADPGEEPWRRSCRYEKR